MTVYLNFFWAEVSSIRLEGGITIRYWKERFSDILLDYVRKCQNGTTNRLEMSPGTVQASKIINFIQKNIMQQSTALNNSITYIPSIVIASWDIAYPIIPQERYVSGKSHLRASIRDLTLRIGRNASSAFALHDYSAQFLTMMVSSSGHESILSEKMATSMTQAGI